MVSLRIEVTDNRIERHDDSINFELSFTGFVAQVVEYDRLLWAVGLLVSYLLLKVSLVLYVECSNMDHTIQAA